MKHETPWKRATIWVAAAALLAAATLARADEETKPVNPYAGDASVVEEGGSLFNQYCSHCHGQWADQGERPRDLRRLKLRYGDDAITAFLTTVNEGRLDKGMPVWKGVLPEATLWKIFTFLMTKQSEE